jgi:hypothetical protein
MDFNEQLSAQLIDDRCCKASRYVKEKRKVNVEMEVIIDGRIQSILLRKIICPSV